VILLGACSGGDDVMVGTRADGLVVSCEETNDDVDKCTPDDGDNACEDWNAGGSAIVLWPPNHKLLRFTLASCAAIQDCTTPPAAPPDEGEPVVVSHAAVPVRITSITSDELVEVGAGGDGHTTDYDVAIIDDVTFDVRSERQGGGDGRVYRVSYVDSDNNPGSCELLVPHDHGSPVAGAVDSGTQVTVQR
jgi:hypothetical protein